MSAKSREERGLPHFFMLAYLITWVLLGPWFFLFNRLWGGSIPWWGWLLVPLAFCGGYGPSLAAIFLSWRQGGGRAVAALLSGLTLWRAHFGWYLLVLACPYGLAALAAVIAVPDFAAAFSPWASLKSVPLAVALALPFGPLGEEVGWRGYALPRLVDRQGPWFGSLTLGVAWTFWHLPMILLQPGAALPSFMPVTITSVAVYLAQVAGITGIMTLVYYNTGRSVLIAVLLHLTFNISDGVLLDGLPDLAAPVRRGMYVVNVGLILVAGLVALASDGVRRIHRQAAC